ncbi:uncharacterized protein ATNIH1004_010834 [Aspergillus tanneri]|uniref:Transcription factor domain-containing protein n=1 Tax=Aspergillus tanneri TaxID=1220188 RepID=A0A5M9M4I0_9EURO|nr:uncharacterized protein ATNIH1004_010834 [Aspergillus tanneri]KAA8641895.1 hypothetical protein ATNIH1004_010834 [Aspergillus tanneri]
MRVWGLKYWAKPPIFQKRSILPVRNPQEDASLLHRTDKNVATLLGRPPRLPHHYCDAPLPLVIADDDPVQDQTSIDTIIHKLDGAGWNREGRFHPAIMLRIRHIFSTLRERVLELGLGNRETRTMNASEHGMPFPRDCLGQLIVQFEYFLSILTVVIDLTRQCYMYVIKKYFCWVYLINGIPSAGVLVTELLCHKLSNAPLPCSTPRSEIIHTLSYLISRMLDDAPNYQPTPLPSSPSGDVVPELKVKNKPDQSGLDSAAAVPILSDLFSMAGEGFLSWLDDLDLDTGSAPISLKTAASSVTRLWLV